MTAFVTRSAVLLVCGIGCLAAAVPAADIIATTALVVALLLAGLALLVRRAARFVRERQEDRDDAVTAAAWRAAHLVAQEGA